MTEYMICEICNGLIEESAADSVQRNRKEIEGGKRGEKDCKGRVSERV